MLCIFVGLCAHINVFSFTHSSLLSIHLNNALHACIIHATHIIFTDKRVSDFIQVFHCIECVANRNDSPCMPHLSFVFMFVYLRIYGMEFVILLVTGVFVCGFACCTFSTVCFSFLYQKILRLGCFLLKAILLLYFFSFLVILRRIFSLAMILQMILSCAFRERDAKREKF